MPTALHVAVAAVVDASGRVLLARRPEHVHQGGLWEFPGGKVEPGERVEEALSRELWEEIHILPTQARRLIQVPFDYPDRRVLLDVWKVEAYQGTAVGREGQPLEWVTPDELGRYPLPAANRPIVTAVSLPDQYAISGPFRGDFNEFLRQLDDCLASGIRLLQLRPQAGLPPELAAAVLARARAASVRVLLNGAPEVARALGFDGVHLNAKRLYASQHRPLPASLLVAASCHDAAELARAADLGMDFAVLSPVAPTCSHPDVEPLGWTGFAALTADVPIPVYALGGVGPHDRERAWAAGGQGVAGISAYWR